MRFYGFSAPEISGVTTSGMLDLDIDPKLGWALANRQYFPVNVNRAVKETLLRVPGFGTRTVGRILQTRRHRTVRYDDLVRMGANLKNARPFIHLPDWSPGALTDSEHLRRRFAPPAQQLQLI